MIQISIPERLLLTYARRFPVRAGKLRIVNRYWRAAASGQDTHRLAHLKYGGLKMPCDLNEMLQRQFYFFGTYFLEAHILRSWQEAAKQAKIIFDVGANAGIYGLAALAIQGDAVVHAFEPTPEIAARLRGTAELNSLAQLHVHEVAVSRQNGHAVLRRFRGESGDNEGMNFISLEPDPSIVERVPTVSLDWFCGQHQIERIDLLKLDIQGNEHIALAGAERMIRSGNVGTIFTELNWARTPGAICPARESVHLLEHAGYLFSKPGGLMQWRRAGEWLAELSDVIARRPPARTAI